MAEISRWYAFWILLLLCIIIISPSDYTVQTMKLKLKVSEFGQK